MATRKPNMGLFKIEEISEKVLATGNHLRFALKYNALDKELVDSVKIINTKDGRETKVNAMELMQAAEAMKRADRSKNFVCGFHGSYVQAKTSRQVPTCPHCMATALTSSIDRAKSLDNEDA